MDDANGDSGAADPVPEAGDGLPARRVPGQRDPAARPGPSAAAPPVPAPGTGPSAAPTTPSAVPGQRPERRSGRRQDAGAGSTAPAREGGPAQETVPAARTAPAGDDGAGDDAGRGIDAGGRTGNGTGTEPEAHAGRPAQRPDHPARETVPLARTAPADAPADTPAGEGADEGVPEPAGSGTGSGPARGADHTTGPEGSADHGAGHASGPGPGSTEAAARAAGHPDSPLDALSDAELVDLVRAGRDSAYEELYRRHAEAVRRYARTCCRDTYTAEDLTGEVFARTLHAIRGGSGPQSAVRAYLLTTVRRVAASWGTTAKREHLVEDFAVFAVTAAGSAVAAETADVGADVRAMREAERSLAVRAFRTLPERWQTVLWHTAVEEESPSAVAPLLGLTPNATAVLAHRAREGLRQAYLQAHVSSSLTEGGACARYADRLGAHARGGLRLRADRELSRHLKECARCSAASLELADLNSTLKGLLPVAYVGWFAVAGAKAAAGAVVAGGAAAAGAVSGVAAAATGSGSGAGAAAGSGAAAEGLGAPVKVGLAATVVVAAAATALALTLTGGHEAARPQAKAVPRPSTPPATAAPAPPPMTHPPRRAAPVPPPPSPIPRPTTPPPSPVPAPPAPRPTHAPRPSPRPTPTPTPSPTPPPTTPPPSPTVYNVNSLPIGFGRGYGRGHGTPDGPTLRPSGGGWWDRWGLAIGGVPYEHGITVKAPSKLTIDLNRPCVSYDAWAGVDDLLRPLRTSVSFAVYGDGTQVWTSGPVRAGQHAVRVHVPLSGYSSIQLVVRPEGGGQSRAALADWADSVITCS